MFTSVTVAALEIKGQNFALSFGHFSSSVSYASEVFWPPQRTVITTTIPAATMSYPGHRGRIRVVLVLGNVQALRLCLLAYN